MSYRGDIRLGETHDFKFSTVSTSAVPTTLSGSPVISAYVGNSATELTAGITLSVDFDSRTGLNNIRVVATSGNGYAVQTDVDLVITTGTVGGVSAVGVVVASFSIENRSALRPATALRDLVVDPAGLADATTVKLGPTGAGTAQTARDLGLAIPAAVAGAAGGLFIAGSNAATSITTALTANIIGNVTGNLSGSVGSVTGAVGSVTAAVTTTAADQQASADQYLNRNLAGGGSGGARIVRDAYRALRNRVAIAAGTATVYAEDDATPAWTAAVTTAAGNPVSEVDPA